MKRNLLFTFLVAILTLTPLTYTQAQYPGWTTYSSSDSPGLDTTSSIFVDNQNNFWFGTIHGVSKFDGQSWSVYNSSNSPLQNWSFVNSIEQVADTMYFGTEWQGVYKFYNNTWEQITTYHTRALKKDQLNNLWIGTDGYGLLKFNAGNITIYNKYNSPLRSNRITDLEIDSQQNLWITMIDSVQYNNYAGIAKFDGTNWTVYHSQNSGLINENIYQVAIDGDGNCWFGADSLYLYKFDLLNWTYVNIEQWSSNWVTSLDIDSSNNVWVGVYYYGSGSGIYMYDGISFTNYREDNSGLPNNTINVIKVDDENNKWIGTWNKLAKYDNTPRLFLLGPNGGENLRSLSNFNITWNYQFVDQINIEFSSDGGNSWNIVASNVNASNNTYNWSVPIVTPPSNQCKIKITDVSNANVSYESDGFFTIYAKVNTPVVTPAAGTYNNNQIIVMSCTTTGASIYYTFDGSDPTQSSILYTTSFPLNNSRTIKAKAFKDGWLDSDTQTMIYQLKIANLEYNPQPGTYQNPLNVAISTLTDSSLVYYTIDGGEPTQNSSLYSSPILIDETKTLKSRAFRVGYTSSDIRTGQYFISNQVITPIISAPNLWIDSDYNGIEANQVDGSGSTISYGSIISYTWYINSDSVASGQTVNLNLKSGTSEIKLKLVGDRGIVAEITKEVTVYCSAVQTNGAISSGVGQMNENTFFVTSFDDQVYKFDSLGTIGWTILTGGDIQSTTCISKQNNIYVGSSDTRLYAFDATGTPKWDRAMGGVIVSSPSVSNDSLIFVGVSTGRLFALTESGTILWNYQTGGAINSSPSVSTDNHVYVGSDDGKLYSVNHQGQFNWAFTTIGPIKSSPAIGNDGNIIFGSNDGSVYKLNISGGMIWQYNAGGNIISSPVIGSDGKIYFGSTNGKVFALSSSGNKLWEYNAGSPISGSPTLTQDENILIGCDDGKLLALSSNGELNWYLQTNNALKAPPLITSNGLILIGGMDSRIYILKNPNLSLLESSSNLVLEWPTFKGNNKRTGNKFETLTSVSTQENDIPKSYSLNQNYPNPFNPSTKISYALPHSGRVQIKVFDLLGQEIITLVNEEKAAGNYQIDFNAISLPSGVYLYRIQAGDFVQTRKMILLK